MLIAVLLALASLAVADTRVFAERGNKDCQDCLAEVEGKCRGPTSSDQFNDCFCGIGEEGLAWPKLTDCLTGSNAKCVKDDEYNILSDWGAHCFAYKKDEEEEVCVDSTQDDKLLMTVADWFCTEFLTLSTGSGSATATATESSSAETTTTDGDDDDDDDNVTSTTTSAPETETSAPSTTDATTTEATTTETTSTTAIPGSDSDVGAGSGGNSDGDDDNSEESSAAGGGDEDDGVASLSATSLSTLAILALSVTGFVLQLF